MSTQTWLQKTQPELMVLWASMIPRSISANRNVTAKDVPNAGVYVLDAGHFALDTNADEISVLLREFIEGAEVNREGEELNPNGSSPGSAGEAAKV
jgi:hypothetical protein